jgi:hypothetical protein
LEYRDAAAVDAVAMIVSGKNIFSFAYAVPHLYLYGGVFLLFGALGKLFFSGVPIFVLLKVLSFVFIFAYTVLVGWELFRRTRSWVLAFLGAGVVFQSVMIAPRPETLGVFLYAFCLVLAQRVYKEMFWVVVLAGLSVMCFYVKPYFILAAPVILIYYFFVSRKAWVWYTISLVCFFVGSYLVINWLFPLYFVNNIVHHLHVAKHDVAYMLRQMRDYMQVYPAFFVALGFGFVFLAGSKTRVLKGAVKGVDIFVIAFLCAVFLIAFSLGQHTGTYLTYYFNLLTIPLVISSISFVHFWSKRYSRFGWYILAVFVAGACFSLLYTGKSLRNMDISEEVVLRQNWVKMLGVIEKHHPEKGYFSPLISAVGVDRGWPVLDNGHTEYFPLGQSENQFLRMLIPASSKVGLYADRWNRRIDERVRSRDFSIIAVRNGYHPDIKDDLLYAHYTLLERVDLYGLHTGLRVTELWVPKSTK